MNTEKCIECGCDGGLLSLGAGEWVCRSCYLRSALAIPKFEYSFNVVSAKANEEYFDRVVQKTCGRVYDEV